MAGTVLTEKVQVRLSRDDLLELTIRAGQEERTVSAVIRRAIRELLAKEAQR